MKRVVRELATVAASLLVIVGASPACSGTAGEKSPTSGPAVRTLEVGDTLPASARRYGIAIECINAWHVKIPGYEFAARSDTVPAAWDDLVGPIAGTLRTLEVDQQGYVMATFASADGDVTFSGGPDGVIQFAASCATRRPPATASSTMTTG